MWTQFMDMCSGGGLKEEFAYIYIEAPEDEAISVFYSRFGHSPERVTCTCCGEDYSITESEDLAQATAYNRGCDFRYFDSDGNPTDGPWHKVRKRGGTGRYVEEPGDRTWTPYVTLEDYMGSESVCFIHACDIEPHERTAAVPDEGYVWV